MVKELVIHLGDCKTGTTSIQATLAKRAWTAEGQDIVYNVPFNHIPFAKSLSENPQERNRRGHREARGFNASDAPFGVISAEQFEFVEPADLKAAITDFFPQYQGRIRLIAYVRPHLDRILSTYAERTKKGEADLDLNAFANLLMRRGRFQYHKRFGKWRDHFGDAFTLRPFIRSELADGDVVADFFGWMFRGAPFTLTGAPSQNQSLSVEDLTMMRYIQRRLAAGGDYRDAQHAFGWNFSEILGALPPAGKSTKLRLHRALGERLADHFREDAAILDRDYFADRDRPMSRAIDANLAATVDKPQSMNPADHHDAAALRLMDGWADLMLRMAKVDERAFRQMVTSTEYRDETKLGKGVLGKGRKHVQESLAGTRGQLRRAINRLIPQRD